MLMKSNKEEYVDLSDKKKNLNNVTPNKRGRANNTAFLYTSLGNKNSKTFDSSINNIKRIQNVSNSTLELNLTSHTVDLEKKNILNLSSDFVKKAKNSVFTNITNNQIKHKNNRNASPEKQMRKSNSNNDIFVVRKEYSPLRFETKKGISFICNHSIYDLENFISNDHLSSSQQLKSKSGIRLYMIFNDNKKVNHSQSLGCLGSKIKEGVKTYTNSEGNDKNVTFDGQNNASYSNEKNERNCDENENEKKKQNDRLKAFEKILEEEKIEEQKKLKKLELIKMKEEEKKKKELERQLYEAKLKEEEERKIEEKLKMEEKIIKEQEEKLREEIKEQERKKREEQLKAQEEERRLKLLEAEKEIEAKLKRKYEEEEKKRKMIEEERKKEEQKQKQLEEEKAKKREEELKKKMDEEIKNKERQFQIQLQKEIIKKEEEIKQKLKQEEELKKRLHDEALMKKKLLEEEQNKLQKLEEELRKKQIEEKKKKEEDLKRISEQEELKRILKEKEEELQRKHRIEKELKDKLKREEELRFQQIKKEKELKKQLAEEEEKRQKLLEEKIRRQKDDNITLSNQERQNQISYNDNNNNKDEQIKKLNLDEITNNIHYHKLIKLQQLTNRDKERNRKSQERPNTYYPNFQQKSLCFYKTKNNSQQNINDPNCALENFISEYLKKDNFEPKDLQGNKRNSTPISKKHFLYSSISERKGCSEEKNNLSIKNKLQCKFINSFIPSLHNKEEQNLLNSKDFIYSEDENSSDRKKKVPMSKFSIPNGKENEQIQEILTSNLSESKKDSNSHNDKIENIIEEYSNKAKKKEIPIYPHKINSFRQFSLSLPKNIEKYPQDKENNSSRSKNTDDNKQRDQNNNQSVLVEEKEQIEKTKKLNRNRSVGSLFHVESTIKEKVDFIPIENKLKKIGVNYPIALQSSVKGKNDIKISNKEDNFCYKYLNYNNLHNKDKSSKKIWQAPKEKTNVYSKGYIKNIFHKSKDKSYWMSFDQFNLKHKQTERFKNVESNNKLNSFVKDRLKEHSIMPANKFNPMCTSKPQSNFLY